jgi:hypothetical protein
MAIWGLTDFLRVCSGIYVGLWRRGGNVGLEEFGSVHFGGFVRRVRSNTKRYGHICGLLTDAGNLPTYLKRKGSLPISNMGSIS